MTTYPAPGDDSHPDHRAGRSGADWRAPGGTPRVGPDTQVHAEPGDPVGGRLREVAALFEGRDRMMGHAAMVLVDLRHADGLHDRLGGMTWQVWLEHVCRIPGADARALLGVVDVLERLPSVLVGLCDRWLSWRQVAAICRAARGVAIARLGELDERVSAAMVDLAGFEPDAILDEVWHWVDTVRPSRLEQTERAAEQAEFVSLSPRLFGGESMYGDFGTAHFATVAEALDAVLDPPAVAPEDLDGLGDDEVDGLFDTLDDARRAHTRDHGAAMAHRLVDLCDHALACSDRAGPDGAAGGGSGQVDAAAGGGSARARPLLLATVDFDGLLDATRAPGWLSNTLAGGRMKVSAATLQRLVDERGADLRGVVLDDCGEVVGVGRATNVPPGWLRQAIWARDRAVRDPDGSCPVRRADLDHVDLGRRSRLDVVSEASNSNVPEGRAGTNQTTSKAWTVTRHDDGSTTWRHRRHGWTLRTAPTRRDPASPPRAGPPRGGPPPPPAPADSGGSPVRQPRLTGVP